MTAIDARLQDLLEPMRVACVEALLEALAGAIAEDLDVEGEAIKRGPDGEVRREGPLNLPARDDMLVRRGKTEERRSVASGPLHRFEPITLVADGGFTTVIAPFRWDNAVLRVEMREEAEWQPLRRWFLEWSQPRQGDVAPDLGGVVHRLEGPSPSERGWDLRLDLGSAPIEAVPQLIGAVALCGALRLRIGGIDG